MQARPHQSPPVPRETTPSTDARITHECERCGAPMEERQCKIICTNCGMMRDCSDP